MLNSCFANIRFFLTHQSRPYAFVQTEQGNQSLRRINSAFAPLLHSATHGVAFPQPSTVPTQRSTHFAAIPLRPSPLSVLRFCTQLAPGLFAHFEFRSGFSFSSQTRSPTSPRFVLHLLFPKFSNLSPHPNSHLLHSPSLSTPLSAPGG